MTQKLVKIQITQVFERDTELKNRSKIKTKKKLKLKKQTSSYQKLLKIIRFLQNRYQN